MIENNKINENDARRILTDLSAKAYEEVAAGDVEMGRAHFAMIRAERSIIVRDALGDPVGVLGAYEFPMRTWSVFGFQTFRFDKHWREVTKAAARAKRDLIADGATRIQAMSLASHTDTHRWLRFLGLTFEVDCPSYGSNGEDFKMFAWIGG